MSDYLSPMDFDGFRWRPCFANGFRWMTMESNGDWTRRHVPPELDPMLAPMLDPMLAFQLEHDGMIT